ncbi:D-alanine--D-alanine ligase [Zooshikella sp. RANM57]|uniref:D-alanine--D-alanine ligase n=1 Tax=Zooshikella sp. RANM57 TaxID=3425863 RepID=UPI003D6DD93B
MSSKKINVAIIFGGKSAEHEVSLQSARNVYKAIDKEKYNPILIGIDKSGKWLLNEDSSFLINADNPQLISLNASQHPITLVPECNGQICSTLNQQHVNTIDVAFPILHGPLGEDGTVQGFLKLANIPFVGSSVLGSAVGMDKDVMKRLLRDAGIPIAKFLTLHVSDEQPSFETLVQHFGLPLFIKPANMGSSIGVHKVKNESDYQHALKDAFSFDVKVIIEEYIEGREIECAVLGNQHPITSTVGEIITNHEFYGYETKYIDENGATIEIPAQLSDDTLNQAREVALRTFKVLSCEGLGRVDMFLTASGKIFVNEINTMPGFTQISMYPKLWEASGISYPALIDKLIQLALERHEQSKRLKNSYL